MFELPERVRAETEALIEGNVQYAAVKAMLLRFEKEGEDAGWDSDLAMPSIIEAYSPSGMPEALGAGFHNVYTEIVRKGMESNGGDAGGALVALARQAEIAARLTRQEPGAAGVEMSTGGPFGWPVVGLGMMSETWMATGEDKLSEEAQRMAAERRLDEFEGRVEGRQVTLCLRDGTTWYCMKARGGEPVVFVVKPEAEFGLIGNIPHGLSRLLNAVTGKVRPVESRGPADG